MYHIIPQPFSLRLEALPSWIDAPDQDPHGHQSGGGIGPPTARLGGVNTLLPPGSGSTTMLGSKTYRLIHTRLHPTAPPKRQLPPLPHLQLARGRDRALRE